MWKAQICACSSAKEVYFASMLDFQNQMAAIEASARLKRIPIRTVCKNAGVAVSNWGRWKRGTSPTFSKWKKVETAAELLFGPDAASSPSLDDRAESHETQ
jgi:hypothetical protein